MSKAQSLSDFIDSCRSDDDLPALWALAVGFYKTRGIGKISYHTDIGRGPDHKEKGVAAAGFPEDWVCHYIQADLVRVDPIPALTLTRTQPFLWSEVPKLMHLSEAQQDYLNEMARAGVGDGLAMQVFGPNLRNAYVGLGFDEGIKQLDPETVFELQCAAQFSHLRYCELTADEPAVKVELSPREREILEWIAKGKSNSVIGDILGVSRHTVDTLTRRIFDKLGVNDRTTAAIKGIGSGVVRYEPAGGM
ncbi:helix-turn-helix transcriptional regulator [Roseovarius sp. 2305UL8-3]|uniref:helix-turn-helix transcriptional regulator n=1 Tax=Roseovarius conchicola TaxID=3121636 RepID=UPI0035272661